MSDSPSVGQGSRTQQDFGLPPEDGGQIPGAPQQPGDPDVQPEVRLQQLLDTGIIAEMMEALGFDEDGEGDVDLTSGGEAAEMGLDDAAAFSIKVFMVALAAVNAELSSDQSELSITMVNDFLKEGRDLAEKNIEKIIEAAKAEDKAEKSGKAMKIIGWISAAAMVVAGAVLTATGVGGPMGVAMMACGVIMAVSMAAGPEGLQKAINGVATAIQATCNFLGIPCSDEVAQIVATSLIGVAIVATAVTMTATCGPAGLMVGMTLMGELGGALVSAENLQKMDEDMTDEQAAKLSMGLTIGLTAVTVLASIGPGIASAVSRAGGVANAIRGCAHASMSAARTAAQTIKAVAQAVVTAIKNLPTMIKSAVSTTAMMQRLQSTLDALSDMLRTMSRLTSSLDDAAAAADTANEIVTLQQRLNKALETLQEGLDAVREGLKAAANNTDEALKAFKSGQTGTAQQAAATGAAQSGIEAGTQVSQGVVTIEEGKALRDLENAKADMVILETQQQVADAFYDFYMEVLEAVSEMYSEIMGILTDAIDLDSRGEQQTYGYISE